MNEERIAYRVALRIAKGRPDDLFRAIFFDIREKAKKFKQEHAEKALVFLKNALIKDLSSKGVKVSNADVKLGRYKGSQFVTSAKLAIDGIKDANTAEQLANYLRAKYSPKFKLKSFNEGTGNYNIR